MKQLSKFGGKKAVNLKAVVAAAFVMATTAPAMAATTLDLEPINEAIATITQVGTLVFAVVVGIKTFQWVRRAL